jgi:hypothetical protein
MMAAVLDGTIKFKQLCLEVGSRARDSIERSVSGLDGVLSIDLGMREREITVKGLLRAVSVELLSARTDAIAELIDGRTHILEAADSREFKNLRVDSFEVTRQDYSGGGVCCEFAIQFTQLRVA